ncbi:unnamed protein product [Chironomus riparius]|uniref:Protein FAM136A n=2 Tax=Chironomus riparius TaxID=315576 RepID=A0A9N9S929_9DIPT|nr:unnamed protein product [Chironomus riparius]
MATINQQRQRVEQEITALVDNLDRSTMRKMQAQMHECAAKCCYDTESSMENVQQCVERCSKPVNKAQSYVQSELERLQNRLQRCVMDCNDQIKDKMPANPNEDQIAKYTGEFERCAIKCVDSSLGTLPSLFKTIKSVLAKGAPDV